MSYFRKKNRTWKTEYWNSIVVSTLRIDTFVKNATTSTSTKLSVIGYKLILITILTRNGCELTLTN